jgi:hypothetical protein
MPKMPTDCTQELAHCATMAIGYRKRPRRDAVAGVVGRPALLRSSRAAASTVGAGRDEAGRDGAGTDGAGTDGAATDIGARLAALEDEVAILEARLTSLEPVLAHKQAVHQDRLLEAVAKLIDGRLGQRG